ncbi:MAG TPA: hypothetical protein VMS78_05010 [Rhizomicrobium sp.]|nr:hypothetical protein [Rhizomicrobium sp.]
MSSELISFTLSYAGASADNNQIDFYDVSQALLGFQRSLALTSHLILTGEIIIQAPSLQGANIIVAPPEAGSWKTTATIIVGVGSAIFKLGTASPDTPIGNLVRSGYDYVISETLGFHVDFNSTLGKQYDELHGTDASVHKLSQSKFDSLIEKCEPAIKNMHRPIIASQTATEATVTSPNRGKVCQIGPILNAETYDYISYTRRDDFPTDVRGMVSSYNMNTFKGRIFAVEEQRPIPFELLESARIMPVIELITNSLAINAQGSYLPGAEIRMSAFCNYSRSGRLKSLSVVEVSAIAE